MDLERRVLGDEHQNVMLTMNGLALLYVLQGKDAQAVALYSKALA